MNPDTNVGGKVTTLSEVSDDQKTTILYFWTFPKPAHRLV